MELRHLRYFVAVAEEENISRAALRLHVSQPALSRQIRDLEDEMGVLLLRRTAKSVELTEAGRAFLNDSRSILEQVAQSVHKARAAEAGAELHVGYAVTPTVRILPPALRAFQSESHNPKVKLHDFSTEEMLANLRSGKIQVALMVRPGPGLLRGLHSEDLLALDTRLGVAPGHPLTSMRSVKPRELSNFPVIALNQKDFPEYHEMLEKFFATGKPRIAEQHESLASLIASVEAGNGVALVPESIACVVGPRLKLLQLSPKPQPLVVAAVWTEANPAAQRFLDCVRKAAKAASRR